jgi:hypothetical protein
LSIVAPDQAHSVIIVAPDAPHPDSHVIKTLLALSLGNGRNSNNGHLKPRKDIVAQLSNSRNRSAAVRAARGKAVIVSTSQVIARTLVQTCRQKGLAVVINHLLDYDGNEIYIKPVNGSVGKQFGEILNDFGRGSIIGLKHANGHVRLLPAMDTQLRDDDLLVAIAESEEDVVIERRRESSDDDIIAAEHHSMMAERTLVLGYNHKIADVISEMANYAVNGSLMHVVGVPTDLLPSNSAIPSTVKGLSVTYQSGDTSDRHMLDQLNVGTYDHVLVLAYSDDLDVQTADAETITTLLHLRDIAKKTHNNFTVVAEIVDSRNSHLAVATEVSDYIVDDTVISRLLTQVADDPAVSEVFEDLLDAEGAEFYFKPAGAFVRLEHPVSFATVVEAARRRNEIAVGYQKSSSHKTNGTVTINPPKDEIIRFSARDRVIVLAEDER